MIDANESDRALGDARVALWRGLSAGAREAFFGAAPGQPLGCGGVERREGVSTHFAMLLFSATKADHLRLRSNEREIWRLAVDGEWERERVCA